MRPTFSRRRHRARVLCEAIGAAFPAAWIEADSLRAAARDWPAFCYLPAARAGPLAAAGPPGARASPAILAILAAWRMTAGIYRIAPDRLHPSAQDPPGADPPRLPEWAIYAELAGEVSPISGRPIVGAWIARDPSGWIAVYDIGAAPDDWRALEWAPFDPSDGSPAARTLRAISAGRIIGYGAPGNPRPVRSGGAWRVFPASGARFWRVEAAG